MKQIARGVVQETKSLDLEGSIDDVISYLADIRNEIDSDELVSSFIEREHCYCWGECHAEHPYILSITRKETDEEYQTRVAAIEKAELAKREEARARRQKKKQDDLALYEKLHKKYGTKKRE